ncbi:MAG: gliding motility-associated C-terminal domain-containing protein [Bacteroidetes bacterium]|nr:gliding motility-associated C-terminal domain-containing protein [Bacteroidota bacterium]
MKLTQRAILPLLAVYLIIGFVTLTKTTYSQLVDPFKIYYQTNQRGGIKYVANSATTCDGGCAAQNEVPPAGTGKNNDFNNNFIDIDGDPSTFMSSSDSLYLPACSEISWAGLFWGGETFSGSPYYATRGDVKIKINNGSYINLTADSLLDNVLTFTSYHCFKDITSLMQPVGGNARITVADVTARGGVGNRFGGWNLVVVYKNNTKPLRNLTVFGGLSHVMSTNPTTDINLNGIFTPPSGAVNFEIGHMSFDGDRDYTQDSLLFKGTSSTSFKAVSDASHNAGNIFNSCLSYNGVLSPYTIPNYSNTLGFDASIFLPNNASKQYISNNDTSATLRLRTVVEGYLTQMVSMAVDIYEPDLHSVVRIKDANGGNLNPGDTLIYTVVTYNNGNDVSVNSYVRDSVAQNQTFVPGSINITYGPNSGPKTDVSSDDQAEYITSSRVVRVRIGTGANATSGGDVLNSSGGTDSTVFVYKTVVTTNCVALLCNNTITNRAWAYGIGQISGNFQKHGSTSGLKNSSNCPVSNVTTLTIQNSCTKPANISNIKTCPGTLFATQFPTLVGYTFYSNAALTNTIAAIPSVGTYYAYYKAYTGCSDTVTIGITSVACDIDGDGEDDIIDLDDDNDGVPDVVEICGVGATSFSCIGGADPHGDADNDGVPNYQDPGFCTLNAKGVCATMDTDGDGIINSSDIDSDNDGMTDVVENGGSDPDNNGQIGSGTGTGIPDSDNDGLADLVDPTTGGTPLTYPNSDSDNVPNYLDLDADNDGIADNIEAQSTTGYILPTATDADKDGLLDVYDNFSGFGGSGVTPVNTDATDLPDYLDLDSDNDNYPDLTEGNDFNGDNVPDVLPSGNDADNDGIDDSYDNVVASSNPLGNVSNNDGPPTSSKFPNVDGGSAELDWRDVFDTDGDGNPNNTDLDDDNDGIPDTAENPITGTNTPNKDTDKDGTPDLIDLDSDNDGITDVVEAGGTDPDNNGQIGSGTGTGIPDSNDDGLADLVDPTTGGTPLTLTNSDSDPIPNYLDIDADNDGIVDNIEAQTTTGYVAPSTNDTDYDGILNSYDNYVGFGGSGLTPTNTDGMDKPDYLDLDTDGDYFSDIIEGNDFDGDGAPDDLATGNDADNDGLDDAYDNIDGTIAANAIPNVANNDGPPTSSTFPLVNSATTELDWRDKNNKIIVPEGFSPNGDGINDYFQLKGIESFPRNEVTIFNRWGNIVFEGKQYDNNKVKWDGTNNNSFGTGDGFVPEGTYFYVIFYRVTEDSELMKLSGYVYVNRDGAK